MRQIWHIWKTKAHAIYRQNGTKAKAKWVKEWKFDWNSITYCCLLFVWLLFCVFVYATWLESGRIRTMDKMTVNARKVNLKRTEEKKIYTLLLIYSPSRIQCSHNYFFLSNSSKLRFGLLRVSTYWHDNQNEISFLPISNDNNNYLQAFCMSLHALKHQCETQ